MPTLSRSERLEAIEDLDRRIAALDADLKPLRTQVSNLEHTRAKLVAAQKTNKDLLRQLDEKPRVSDHPVIRYLERKHGFSFEEVCAELLTPAVRQAMDLGAEGVRVRGGSVKLNGRTITTFVADA